MQTPKLSPEAQKILTLMFRPGEGVCVSPNQFAYHCVSLERVLSGSVDLVSPRHRDESDYLQCQSNELTLVALNPIDGWRMDVNCTSYRNFLVELDEGDLYQQFAYIAQLGLPYSAVVFSGGKSLHFLISLDEDLADEDEYRDLARWILSVVSLADQNTKNPSRCYRIPGVMRDTGKMQRLIEFKGPIEKSALMTWLGRFPTHKPADEFWEYEDNSYNSSGTIPAWVQAQLDDGLDFSAGRNKKWFQVGCDFAKAGFSYEDALSYLRDYFTPERDFTEREWRSAIKSGFNSVANR